MKKCEQMRRLLINMTMRKQKSIYLTEKIVSFIITNNKSGKINYFNLVKKKEGNK